MYLTIRTATDEAPNASALFGPWHSAGTAAAAGPLLAVGAGTGDFRRFRMPLVPLEAIRALTSDVR